MKVIKAEGNGSCLFISLRLALECVTVLKKARDGETVPSAVIDGSDERVLKSADSMRTLIVKWYHSGLDRDVPGLGSYVQATESSSGRTWRRGDILAMEMVRAAKDVPEEGLERIAAMLKYLDIMKLRSTWGGTPEYTAFAILSKLTVEVYQPASHGGLMLVDKATPENSMGLIKLLFNGHSHYDLLLSDADATDLLNAWPCAKISSIA